MSRIFLIAFVLSGLAASAAAQTTSTPVAAPAVERTGEKPSPKRQGGAKPSSFAEGRPCQIGIIPIVGIGFSVQKIGFGIFGNDYTRVVVSDWGFDDLVAARVRAAAPHFAVRRIIFAREELARHKSPFSSFNVELKNFVRDVSAGANCERYVVVHLEGSKVFDSPESVFGLGIVNVPSPFQRRNFLFAITNIRIYDGQSFEVIRQDLASTGEESLVSNVLRFTPFRGPKRELDDASFPVAPLQATSSRVLREGVRALLAASLDRTLPALLRDDTLAEREVHTLTSCQPTACASAQAPAQSHDVSKRISR